MITICDRQRKDGQDMNRELAEAPIGVFDSGVGGLTVAREIMRNLPAEHIVYFGDTARLPYGSKSRETILTYSRQIIRFLQTQNVKAIVVACNTASAFALDEISKESDLPMIGVVKPGARTAAGATFNRRIGVIGTEGTVDSHIYRDFIKQIDSEITVIEKACPLFVPLVEEHWIEDPITRQVAHRYLEEMKEQKVDTLVLGCTHYPLLRSLIGEVMGSSVVLVNPAYETAQGLKRLLQSRNLANPGTDTKEFPYRFFVSDLAEKFKVFANSILPYDVGMTQKIDIEEY